MESLTTLLENQRRYFDSGVTRPLAFRIDALKRLQKTIREWEKPIHQALAADLGKAPMESYMTETGMVLEELGFALKHLRQWARPEHVHTPLAQFPSRSFILKEPYGLTLIMAPWNYPLQLSLSPLVGAIAAGNCAVVKPSAYAPATSRVIAGLIADAFPAAYIAVVEGGRQENQELLSQKFDTIFFTGGVEVGKLVMEKAAQNLTPVILELGGKSPCIVDASANIPLAARRIAFGKFLNAGQTCVAPDYILVENSIKDALIKELAASITAFFGSRPLDNPDYPKIINEKHLCRLQGLLQGANVITGGQCSGQKMAPTLLDAVTPASPCMQEEIFGPILPILPVSSIEEAVNFAASRPKPLALYLFTRNKAHEALVFDRLSFGGGCVNDTIIHLATSHMGFGGVGNSGMGSYHGKRSFDAFSHEKSIVRKGNWLDLPMRYHPYTPSKEGFIRKFLK